MVTSESSIVCACVCVRVAHYFNILYTQLKISFTILHFKEEMCDMRYMIWTATSHRKGKMIMPDLERAIL